MEKYEVDQQEAKYHLQRTGLKLLLWLLGISIVGTIVCIILAALRVALEVMVIVAGVLLVIALLCIVGYNAVKYKVKAHEYQRQLDKQERDRISQQ